MALSQLTITQVCASRMGTTNNLMDFREDLWCALGYTMLSEIVKDLSLFFYILLRFLMADNPKRLLTCGATCYKACYKIYLQRDTISIKWK